MVPCSFFSRTREMWGPFWVHVAGEPRRRRAFLEVPSVTGPAGKVDQMNQPTHAVKDCRPWSCAGTSALNPNTYRMVGRDYRLWEGHKAVPKSPLLPSCWRSWEGTMRTSGLVLPAILSASPGRPASSLPWLEVKPESLCLRGLVCECPGAQHGWHSG